MSDPWTAAWEEAEATAPPQVTIYDTLELQHPTFDQPVRVVNTEIDGTTETMNFTLEDASTVAFTICAFFAERPEFSEGKPPECTITVDNVARLLVPYLKTAVAQRADLTAIYRQFRSDDTSEPCFGPVTFSVRRVSVKGTQISGIARIDDLQNKKFPTKVYTISQFPGLQGV